MTADSAHPGSAGVTFRAGFTLVELVVVVVIVGIISALALPRLSRGSQGAAEATIAQDLKILRTAIHMYTAEHGGVLPGAVGDGKNAAGSAAGTRRQLTMRSNADGVTSRSLDRSIYPFGPYLRAIPKAPLGPVEGDDRIRVVSDGVPLSGGASPNRAWKYDTVTGQIIFNYNGKDSLGVNFDDY